MRRIGSAWLAFVAALAVGCAGADTDNDVNNRIGEDPAAVGTAGDPDANEPSAGDRDFVEEIGYANMAEIELGRLALQQGNNAQVKKFAQMMIDDHTKAGEDLRMVASQHNISMPTDLDEAHRDLHNRLSQLKGAEFDREYVDAMVEGHQDVLDTLGSRVDQQNLTDWRAWFDRDEAQRGEAPIVNPEESDNAATMALNRWAATAYPTVHRHHAEAERLDETLR